MRLKIAFSASIAKDSTRPDLNEDAWSANAQRTCYALCDGATES